ncbi:MAG: transglycosylase SLT domain-containing protein [Candidatus Cloacimonadota bacterium]|nr:transglycosylase SLT domain-containing protein [Candidatus Cloacimonadota bacterium]
MDFSNLQQAQTLQSLNDSKLTNAKNQTDAKKASQQFEAMFVKIMFKSMTETIENDSLFGSGAGSDYYNDMYLDNMAETVSKTDQVGLANTIYRQITQENNPPKDNEIRPLNQQDFISSEKNIFDKVLTKLRARNASKIDEVATKDKSVFSEIGSVLQERLDKFSTIINKASQSFGVDKELIKAIISQESYGNPNAVSHAGAKGLMQLMDGTADGLGVKDSFDPEENIMAGTKYLKIMMSRFKDKKLALAAYNAGAGNVLKYKGIPPFKETQNYVNKVMQYYNNFQK